MHIIHVPLRYRMLILLVLLALSPFFFIGGFHSLPYPILKSVRDSGHFIFFGLMTFYALVGVDACKRVPPLRLWLLFTLVALALGLAIEWIQGGFGRDSDFGDVRRDLLGVWLVFFFLYRFQQTRVRVAIATLLLLCLSYEAYPVYRTWQEEQRIQKLLPTIVAIEQQADLEQMYGQMALTDEQAAAGKYSAKIHFDMQRRKGLTIYRLPHDWRGYHQFVFQAYNPDTKPFRLYVAVADSENVRHHSRDFRDRYERSVMLEPGWNKVAIDLDDIAQAPHTRELDLSDIVRVWMFVWQTPSGDLFIDDIHLD